MERDAEIIKSIERAAVRLGEQDLRARIQGISSEYHGKNRTNYWPMAIAASVVLLIGSYFIFLRPKGEAVQQMKIDDAPILSDSARFESDTLKIYPGIQDTLINESEN